MRTKICGITNVEDAVAAGQAGADAIGLNFVGGPRRLETDVAREILIHRPPLMTVVALVRVEGGEIADPLIELLGESWVSHLQVYGEPTAQTLVTLAAEGFRPIPVIKVRDEGFADEPPDWLGIAPPYRPSAVVLDAYDPQQEGGTGRAFNWSWIAAARDAGHLDEWPAIILAGGLNPDNVAEAVRAARPYAVDVSSGVEREPGRKDAGKMREFVRNARLDREGG